MGVGVAASDETSECYRMGSRFGVHPRAVSKMRKPNKVFRILDINPVKREPEAISVRNEM